MISRARRQCVGVLDVTSHLSNSEGSAGVALGARVANNVTMPNRPALESGRSMTLRWYRRGKYIV
jgi:hypothetical protein